MVWNIGDIAEVNQESRDLTTDKYRGIIYKIKYTRYGNLLYIKIPPSIMVNRNSIKGNTKIINENRARKIEV